MAVGKRLGSLVSQAPILKRAALELGGNSLFVVLDDAVLEDAVMPGNILTEGLKAQAEGYLAQMKASIPAHTLGEPEDIGYAVCFPVSGEAKFVTGQTIIVDGGQILPESPDALL